MTSTPELLHKVRDGCAGMDESLASKAQLQRVRQLGSGHFPVKSVGKYTVEELTVQYGMSIRLQQVWA